ncbi:neutral/alkaline ceramidase [Ralstonia flaminis]|jgi:neutral ceramidase|uniref:Neutral ceramidase n=1 Tax=Ralstonia flaminis TaxID=3058597 RepID=A0ABM9K4X5_9RALS|nr:neutral/alkaline ceramidase [Ralstonia sp. LMG 18101]CAJ0813381.1 Neutral ceramidase [Ralstonia sp. LMG 18101]
MMDRRTWKQGAALSAALLVLGGCGGSEGGGTAPVATAATRSVQSVAQAASPAAYNIGTGISDITGEAAEAGMFGYSKIDQQTGGIHQRQRARAFIIEDPATKQRVAIVVTETGAVMQGVQQAVLARLKARYGALYTDANVLLTATHTHAGPGGFSHYALYNLNALGYLPQTFNAIVDGMVEAIVQAHDNVQPGEIDLNQSELHNASRNRSAPAFRANPAADRAVFPEEIDPLVTQLTFRRAGQAVGVLNLFATHGTSMTNTNTLISADNKGYAAYHFEHDVMGVRYLEGKGFVAAFAQTNAGDMTPNLNLKPGSGPTENEFDNTRIIGERQFGVAQALVDAPSTPLAGGVDVRQRYVEMGNVTVEPAYTGDGQRHTTCPAAIGTTLAAGSTEDGPGPGVALEGQSNPFLAALGGLLFTIPDDLRKCHAPKELFVPTGLMRPVPWTPPVLPVQLVRIGPLYLAAVPAELTIMSGYRIRRQLARTLGTTIHNVLAVSYSNAYSQYVTTPEEYDVQDYEGGSTLFGRWTQPAYMQELDRLAQDMAQGRPTTNTLTPADLSRQQMTFQTGVVLDAPPLLHQFGDVKTDAAARYTAGQTVSVVFVTGHPKNNLHRNDTFVKVQRLVDGAWKTVAVDGDWSTQYRWKRVFGAESEAQISWTIPTGTPAGTYRIVHQGDAKNLLGTITPFMGTSRSFEVN